MKLLFQNIVFSCITPSYYSAVRKKTLRSTFNFYIIVSFFLSFIFTTIVIANFFYLFSPFLYQDIKEILISSYPDELIISVNNGTVTTNVEEPYQIPFSSFQTIIDSFHKKIKSLNALSVQNILVIDTSSSSSSQFQNYSTFALLAKHSFYYKGPQSIIKEIPLTVFHNVVIDKKSFTEFINRYVPYFYLIPIIFFIFILIQNMGFFIVRIILLFFLSIAIWLLLKLIRISTPITDVARILLHSNFVPYIFILILTTFYHRSFLFVEIFLQIVFASVIIFFTNTKNRKKTRAI